MNRRLSIRLYFILTIMTVLTAACANAPAATESPTPSASTSETAAPAPTATPVPTNTSSPTLTPTATGTPAPTSTSSPTLSPSPTPTPTPTPFLRQLTRNGCCVQPFFSPDNEQVLFIDKPADSAPVGIYGVDFDDPQPTPVLVSELIGFRNPDRSIVAAPEGNLIRFTRETTGESWTVDTGGNFPRFSPDSEQIIWTASDQEGPYDRRQTDIWLANLDGSQAELRLSLYGGGFAGWFPDGKRVLLIGRDDPAEEKVTMFVYDLNTGARTELYRQKRLRRVEISPQVGWIVFYITFADTPEENGIWLSSPDGTELRQLDVPGFGAYRWRDAETLLYIPLRSSADESMRLWSINAATGKSMPLTDPASLQFSIANGDWTVSPDGRHVVFVNSVDQNIWAITLP